MEEIERKLIRLRVIRRPACFPYHLTVGRTLSWLSDKMLKSIFLALFDFSLTPNPGKILIIGGSIANFTNVAATFKVIGHSDCSFWGAWV